MSELDVNKTSRVAIGVEYNGSAYHGWQKNLKQAIPTVQAKVEIALSKIANHPVKVVCAGRTDTGVHACDQVAHFDTHSLRKLRAWTRGANGHLPSDIAIKWARDVPDDFHARFSATARRYRYVIYNASIRPAVLSNGVTFEYRPLDHLRMHEAVQWLLGENDFTSFRSSICQSWTPMRNLHSAKVERFGQLVVIEIKGNAFLHHMIRNIAGVLLKVGVGKAEPIWAKEVLQAKDRTKACKTASPAGLYFVNAYYPDEFELPFSDQAPFFLNAH
mgnify:CR=1 FL=1